MTTAPHIVPSAITPRDVLRLASPVVVSMLSHTLMTSADAVVVGWLGTEPLAAVGLAAIAVFLVRSMAFGLLSGVRISTARATGANDVDTVGRLGTHGLYIALILGCAAALAAPLAGAALSATGASPEVVAHARVYLGILLLGSVPAHVLFACTAWFQGRGDTRTPMKANLLANAVNVALDPLLVFGAGPIPAMGIGGAAIATVIATIVGSAWLLPRFLAASRGTSRRPSRRVLGVVLNDGGPLALAWSLDVASYAGLSAVLARSGDAHLAAHVVAVRIISVSFLPGHAIAEATGVLVGQAIGAGRPDLARQARRAGLRVATTAMSGMALVFLGVPGPLLAVFGTAPDVYALARVLLVFAAGFQIFDAVAMVLYFSLSAWGDTRFVSAASTVTAWFVKLPLAIVLALHLGYGAPGAWAAITAEVVVMAGVLSLRSRYGRTAPARAAVPG